MPIGLHFKHEGTNRWIAKHPMTFEWWGWDLNPGLSHLKYKPSLWTSLSHTRIHDLSHERRDETRRLLNSQLLSASALCYDVELILKVNPSSILSTNTNLLNPLQVENDSSICMRGTTCTFLIPVSCIFFYLNCWPVLSLSDCVF
jgi:hypothetical protein